MAGNLMRRPRSLSRTWHPFRLFEDFLGGTDAGFGLPDLWAEERFVPAIDVTEDENGLALTAEVPGIEKDDLDVAFEDGVLIIRGEKKEEKKTETAGTHRLERRYGHFERRIRLPDNVDTGKIEASYRDGVLKLAIPKSEQARPRAIEIK